MRGKKDKQRVLGEILRDDSDNCGLGSQKENKRMSVRKGITTLLGRRKGREGKYEWISKHCEVEVHRLRASFPFTDHENRNYRNLTRPL